MTPAAVADVGFPQKPQDQFLKQDVFCIFPGKIKVT